LTRKLIHDRIYKWSEQNQKSQFKMEAPDPLSKIILHRHNGKVDLIRENGNILVMKIELPIGLTEEGQI